MANYQVLFNGEVAKTADTDRVRDNLARELGLDARKAKQLFSGRTVVIRNQLDQSEALAWQDRLAQLGAIVRIKSLATQNTADFKDADKTYNDHTLRDITAAHLECPRCGHLQLDASHCARCGVDLEAAFRQKRKEDLLIEKKLRELRAQRNQLAQPNGLHTESRHEPLPESAPRKSPRKGVLHWLKRD